MSDVKLVTILTDMNSSDIADLEFSDRAGKIFLTVSSDIPAGLYATTKDGKTYSISSPLAGTSWTFSDAGVVSVTDTGLIHGLRNRETTITAEYLGQTASVDTPGEVPDNNSGGGGC